MTGKAFYRSAAVQDPDDGAWRPACADAVEAAGGRWKVCVQDSDTAPAVFVVAVGGQAPAHDAAAAAPATALLGTAVTAARQAARAAGITARLNDQDFAA